MRCIFITTGIKTKEEFGHMDNIKANKAMFRITREEWLNELKEEGSVKGEEGMV